MSVSRKSVIASYIPRTVVESDDIGQEDQQTGQRKMYLYAHLLFSSPVFSIFCSDSTASPSEPKAPSDKAVLYLSKDDYLSWSFPGP